MTSNIPESKFKSIRAQVVYYQKAGIGTQLHPTLINEQNVKPFQLEPQTKTNFRESYEVEISG